tara:strand:+ start:5259 stop:5792 length:534 start_codon:yes stop_codon:yes gene_type:complete
MSCNLTSGRIVPCKNKSGSIKTVFFADYGTLGDITESAGLISAFAGTPVFYKFDVRGTTNLDTVVTSSRENGTTFYTQSLTLQLQYYDRATSEQIKLLAVGRPHIVVVDADDNYLLVGRVNGGELTTGNFTVGANMGDFNGFNLTFEAIEKNPPDFITGSVVLALDSTTQINTFPTS